MELLGEGVFNLCVAFLSVALDLSSRRDTAGAGSL